MPTLLEEVLAANREHVSGNPVPRPPGLGDGKLLVLCCSDPRLTVLLPTAMGVAPEEMFQVRNPGNQALGRNMLRSVVAALVLDIGTEVFVVGHTDCAMCQATTMTLLDGMKRLGIPREALEGQDIREWFGAIASERSNAMDSARLLRKSPAFPPDIPVHALLVDTGTGRLDVLEDGNRTLTTPPPSPRTSSPVPVASGFHQRVPGPPPATEPQPEPLPELAPIPEIEPAPPPPPKPRPKPPPPPRPRERKVRETRRPPPPEDSPFERAEEVLKRLMKRRKR